MTAQIIDFATRLHIRNTKPKDPRLMNLRRAYRDAFPMKPTVYRMHHYLEELGLFTLGDLADCDWRIIRDHPELTGFVVGICRHLLDVYGLEFKCDTSPTKMFL